MYKLFPGKTPPQMQREAEQCRNPAPAKPAGKADPSKYPSLRSDTGAEIDATIEWLAHIAGGRIQAK
jgi:hypothetical protein